MTLHTARSYDGFLKIYHKRESRWKEKALQVKGKFYWHCEFSCSELNCSLKPAFVSVQPLQSLTLEPLTLSRVLQPHLSMPRWQKKWCLSSSETTTFRTFTVHPILCHLPAGPRALVSTGWLLDWLDSTRHKFYTQHCVWTDDFLPPPEYMCGGIPGVEMMGGKQHVWTRWLPKTVNHFFINI